MACLRRSIISLLECNAIKTLELQKETDLFGFFFLAVKLRFKKLPFALRYGSFFILSNFNFNEYCALVRYAPFMTYRIHEI